MGIYTCRLCGCEYIPEDGDISGGVPAGTDFEDITEDWVCPICGALKDDFELVEDREE